MPYEIVALLDEMPSGRVRKPKVDKYAEMKELLNQVPPGKTAQIAMPKSDYRKFSAGARAAGVQLDRKIDTQFRNGNAFVQWEPITEENRPKKRGGRRKKDDDASGRQVTLSTTAQAPVQNGRRRR